ncbi:MAG: hypothetical protein EXR99_16535 [Gemmataceae bacterium]|nr:hypothetical protein [Gemmataceae bacterium]
MLETGQLILKTSQGGRVEIASPGRPLGFALPAGGVFERAFHPAWEIFETEDSPLVFSMKREKWLGNLWKVRDSEELLVGQVERHSLFLQLTGEDFLVRWGEGRFQIVKNGQVTMALGKTQGHLLELSFTGMEGTVTSPFFRMLALAWGILEIGRS